MFLFTYFRRKFSRPERSVHELLFRPQQLAPRHARPIRWPQHEALSVFRTLFAHRTRTQPHHLPRSGWRIRIAGPARMCGAGSPIRGRDARGLLGLVRFACWGRMRSRIVLQRSFYLPRKMAARGFGPAHACPFRTCRTWRRKTWLFFALSLTNVTGRCAESDARTEFRAMWSVTLQHHVKRAVSAGPHGCDVEWRQRHAYVQFRRHTCRCDAPLCKQVLLTVMFRPAVAAADEAKKCILNIHPILFLNDQYYRHLWTIVFCVVTLFHLRICYALNSTCDPQSPHTPLSCSCMCWVKYEE